METILLFLAFVVWSFGCFLGGIMFSTRRSVNAFIRLFNKEKLKAAYVGDESDIKNKLGVK